MGEFDKVKDEVSDKVDCGTGSSYSSTKGRGGFPVDFPCGCELEPMRKMRVAVITSRRKVISARKSENIAAIKSTVISLDKFTGRKVPVKRLAMVIQVSRAQTVPKVIDRFIRRARAERRRSSSKAGVLFVSSGRSICASSSLARSTIRPSRFVKTLSRVATPEIKKTGAIASWITCAMAEIGVSAGISPYVAF